METREIFDIKFGPKVIEAFALVIKDEINLLRLEHGLSERTNQQIIDTINNKLSALPDYTELG